MKKMFIPAALAFAVNMWVVSVFAEPEGETTMIVLSQGEILDYILYAGIGVFLIGMIFILLSVYVKLRDKDEDADYDDEDEPCSDLRDEEYSEEEQDEQEETNNPEDEAETVSGIEEETELKDTGEEEEPETGTEEPEFAENEKTEEDMPEEDEAEEDLPKVRITLSGTNNPDVRIVEFTESAKVGRKTCNDVVISDSTVSGIHCEFTYKDEKVYINDLDSTNGTLVNGEKVVISEVKSGDVIVIGKPQYRVSISLLSDNL